MSYDNGYGRKTPFLGWTKTIHWSKVAKPIPVRCVTGLTMWMWIRFTLARIIIDFLLQRRHHPP